MFFYWKDKYLLKLTLCFSVQSMQLFLLCTWFWQDAHCNVLISFLRVSFRICSCQMNAKEHFQNFHEKRMSLLRCEFYSHASWDEPTVKIFCGNVYTHKASLLYASFHVSSIFVILGSSCHTQCNYAVSLPCVFSSAFSIDLNVQNFCRTLSSDMAFLLCVFSWLFNWLACMNLFFCMCRPAGLSWVTDFLPTALYIQAI